MQYKLHRALRESFTSHNFPIPPLPAYRKLPMIAVQRDAHRPLWSYGTFAMSTTLHLLLGGSPPHTLPTLLMTLEHMLALHIALLEWLIRGTPPSLWNMGCLNRGILPPRGTYTGPHECISIAAANLLPKGQTRVNPCSPLGTPPVPSVLGTVPVETPLHSLPLTGALPDHSAANNPHRAQADSVMDKSILRPAPSAHQAPTSRSSRLLRRLSTR
jgi:hypothetical protein